MYIGVGVWVGRITPVGKILNVTKTFYYFNHTKQTSAITVYIKI